MMLPFVKMHGLGNDFVLIDARGEAAFAAAEAAEHAAFIADRKRGIGCDQIALLEDAPEESGAECAARFFNADGSPSGACGNATRCIGLYLTEKSGGNVARVYLGGRVAEITKESDGRFTANIGAPVTEAKLIPLAEACDTLHVPGVGAGALQDGCATQVGNPHITFFVDDLDRCGLEAHGAALEHHPMFPERVNVGAAQIISRDHLRLRVFERGAGETAACGTGACAAFSAARRRGLAEASARVVMPGGELRVSENEAGELLLTGPARFAFAGAFSFEMLRESHER